MAEFEWATQASRTEVAALLRRLADGIDADGEISVRQDGWELKLDVPHEMRVELEYEVEDGGSELEIELSWGGEHDDETATPDATAQ